MSAPVLPTPGEGPGWGTKVNDAIEALYAETQTATSDASTARSTAIDARMTAEAVREFVEAPTDEQIATKVAEDESASAGAVDTRIDTKVDPIRDLSDETFASNLSASYAQKPTTDLGDWALLRRDTTDVAKGVAWTTPNAAVARALGWEVLSLDTDATPTARLTSLNAAIEARSAAGGGVVWLEAGNWETFSDSVRLKSNVVLKGAGRGRTVIALTGTAFEYVLLAHADDAVTNFAVEDLTVVGVSDGDDFITPIFCEDATDGFFSNVDTEHGRHSGIELMGCERVNGHNIGIRHIRRNTSVASGGNGLWFFRGTSDCHWSNVTIEDYDGNGVFFDAGTNTGGGIVCARNTVTGVILRDGGREPIGGHAVIFSGAHDNVVTGVTVDGCGTLADQSAGSAVFFQIDQTEVTSERNVVTGVVARNIVNVPIRFNGGVGNRVSNVVLKNFAATGSGTTYPVYFTATMRNSTVGHCEANVVDGLTILAPDAGYQSPTHLVALTASGGGGAQVRRNRISNVTYGAASAVPATGYVTSGTTADIILTGADTNVFDPAGIDTALGGFGIYFGASRDVRLHRAFASNLTCTGSFSVTGTLTAGSNTTAAPIILNGPAGGQTSVRFNVANASRWRWQTDGVAESGSNAGTNLTLVRYADDGTTATTVLTVVRATGRATFAAGVGQYGVNPPSSQPAANADTSGATLTQLETEVNELKALLRSFGMMAT